MKTTIFLFLSIISFAAIAQPKVQGKTWQKVDALSDEFNETIIDENKWNLGPDGHPDLNWQGRSPALFQKESFGIGDGFLSIEVGELPKPITMGKSKYLYHGGILRSFVTSSIGHY